MKKLMIALAFAGMGAAANAQSTSIETPSKYTVATNSFWSNWYIQVGVDMSLQNPYGKDFSDVFPNGKSFGANLAIGKWFTPGIGIRGKVNWENGLLQANRPHNFWTSDGDKGGYLGIYFDTQFNLSNLFCGYNESRVWNLIAYPRMGVIRNYENNCYTPALGVGLENTWKVSKLVNIYLDAAYTFTTGAYSVVDNDPSSTHTNGILSVDLGVQFNLGKSTWTKAVSVDAYNALAASSEEALAKLRSDLDAERRRNKDLQAQLAKAPKNTAAATQNVITSAASSVFFNINSSKIVSKKDLINLEAVAAAAKNSNAKVVVTGTADSKTGTSAYNQKLSEARAKAVADELVNLGVSRDKIEVKGIGGVNDVTPYNLNRRAIVELR
ncbi:MAG: OmpA family protein [Bacteroides sp.]|nr:OmpA family protein [Roseburia sp.]MCM1345760.1 OmpA family protein [Bacteroides sp.]MCM1420145.1 OmpA family protein [Bacteroides sp.]